MNTAQGMGLLLFFFNDTATTEIYTLSLHDALPISPARRAGPTPRARGRGACGWWRPAPRRSARRRCRRAAAPRWRPGQARRCGPAPRSRRISARCGARIPRRRATSRRAPRRTAQPAGASRTMRLQPYTGTAPTARGSCAGRRRQLLRLLLFLAEPGHALPEPADRLAEAGTQLRQLGRAEEEEREREDHHDFAETEPHRSLRGGCVHQDPPGAHPRKVRDKKALRRRRRRRPLGGGKSGRSGRIRVISERAPPAVRPRRRARGPGARGPPGPAGEI